MNEPDSTGSESTRIEALTSLNILDTKPHERFDRLTRLAKRLFGVQLALVSLVDANSLWLKYRLGLESSDVSREISFSGNAILRDEILIVNDKGIDESLDDNPWVTYEPRIRFYAGVTLADNDGNKIGTLCLIDQEPRSFSEEDQEVLRDLGHMAEQELAAVQLATMDELTQLSNRRGFIALAIHALNLCKRLHKPATLFFFDLDLFKDINDRFGHAEGDRALIGFGKILKEVFRESDVIGRLGGDEFVALLTNTERAESELILSRLEKTREEFNRNEARGYDILCSVGTIEFDSSRHKSIEDLLEDADQLMYQQKQKKKII